MRAAIPTLATFLFLVPCVADAQAAPTFTRDVAPILYKNCGSCHRPGGMGPMSLLTYAEARDAAADIRDLVGSGQMPPWHADAPHGTFLNDRRLSDEHKQTIQKWVDAGAPMGDPRDLPPAPEFSSDWEVGKPDVVLTMSTEFEVPATGTIPYQYFEVPTNFAEDRWVRAIEIMPGAREVVHHVLVYARPPASAAAATATATATATVGTPLPAVLVPRRDHGIPPRQRDPNAGPTSRPTGPLGALVGTTAPGTNVVTFPEGTALRIRAGSVLTLQMHYTAHGHATKDRSSVGMVFAKEPPVEEMRAAAFVNGQFVIPPGAADFSVPSEIGFRDTVKVWAMMPHTHLRGVRWEYRLVQPDGSSEVLLSVPRYDFNWQTYYQFAKPVEILPGGKIEAIAWYDNSTRNRANPDPTAEVRWGDQTWEEMQYTGFLYTINSRRLSPPRQ